MNNYTGIKAWEYKDSLLTFFIDAWKVLEPDTHLVLNFHHEYLASKLEEILHRVRKGEPRPYDTIINIPPGTTKSTLITIVFPVWCWLWAPNLKFISASHSESLSVSHAVKSRDIILSEWFQNTCGHIFKLKYDTNKKSEYANDSMGLRCAFSVGTSPIGRHADIFLCDDPTDAKKAVSPVQIQSVNNWWDKTVSTRLTNQAVSTKIIVMQRLSSSDLTAYCFKKELEAGVQLYESVCLPAEVSKNVKPKHLITKYIDGLFDPVRLSRVVLQRQRIILGSIGYAGQYLQTPVAEEGALVDPAWFQTFQMNTLQDRLFDSGEDLVINFYLDGAYTADTTNDPTSIIAAAKVGHSTYIFDAIRVWMELPELLKFIPEFMHRNNADEMSRLYVEPKASGLSIVQMLERYTKINVVSDKPPKDSKVQRLKSVLPYIEARRVNLLANSAWIDMYIEELKNFPYVEHDDLTDVTTMCLRRHSYAKEESSIFGMSSN